MAPPTLQRNLPIFLRGGAEDDAIMEALSRSILQKPKRHGFEENTLDKETRRMNQIGG